ncbi:hypothetical protein AMTRI_Chr02g265290 [Amborella trichopoda]
MVLGRDSNGELNVYDQAHNESFRGGGHVFGIIFKRKKEKEKQVGKKEGMIVYIHIGTDCPKTLFSVPFTTLLVLCSPSQQTFTANVGRSSSASQTYVLLDLAPLPSHLTSPPLPSPPLPSPPQPLDYFFLDPIFQLSHFPPKHLLHLQHSPPEKKKKKRKKGILFFGQIGATSLLSSTSPQITPSLGSSNPDSQPVSRACGKLSCNSISFSATLPFSPQNPISFLFTTQFL